VWRGAPPIQAPVRCRHATTLELVDRIDHRRLVVLGFSARTRHRNRLPRARRGFGEDFSGFGAGGGWELEEGVGDPLVGGGGFYRKAADRGWNGNTEWLRGELRFFSAEEFPRGLREFGLDTRGRFFEPQSPEVESLVVVITNEEAEPVRHATLSVDSNATGEPAQQVSGGGYSEDAIRSAQGIQPRGMTVDLSQH
jgi:hypothetical protein